MAAVADLPHLLLATAATAVHVALLSTAPFVSDLARASERLLEARSPAPFGHGWRSIASPLRSPDANASPSMLASFALTAAAALLVPSFATGMLTGPLDDLPLIALLLAAGRVASEWGAPPVSAGRSLGAVVLSIPALLLASLALALIAGRPGLDAAIEAAPSAAAVPLGLVALALALTALADTGAEADLAGPVATLRLLVWLDLVACLLPPWSTTPSSAGPIAWLAALLLWPVKIALLAILLGSGRFMLASWRPSWRLASLRAASLLALLSGVFVLIGQRLE